MSADRPAPNCMKCRYFYVTYDPVWPRGCRVFDFKGKQLPSVTVKAVTGQECPMFQPRPTAASDRDSHQGNSSGWIA